jgi:hypothetical protein
MSLHCRYLFLSFKFCSVFFRTLKHSIGTCLDRLHNLLHILHRFDHLPCLDPESSLDLHPTFLNTNSTSSYFVISAILAASLNCYWDLSTSLARRIPLHSSLCSGSASVLFETQTVGQKIVFSHALGFVIADCY